MLIMLAIWDGWLRFDPLTVAVTAVLAVIVLGIIVWINEEVERQQRIDREKEMLELARRQEQREIERERETDGGGDA